MLSHNGWTNSIKSIHCSSEKKILAKYKVELIGATKNVGDKAENREFFKKSMSKIGLDTPFVDLVAKSLKRRIFA